VQKRRECRHESASILRERCGRWYTIVIVHPQPRVLIVDDVAATRTGLAELLRLRGYAAQEAATGEEGLRRLREDPATGVVVLDLRMPGGNGFWFREQQLADPLVAHIPVIVFTGVADAAAAAAQLRISEVMRKPVAVDDLLAAIARHCERRTAV
jgi:CheY-like chemotaxis protein